MAKKKARLFVRETGRSLESVNGEFDDVDAATQEGMKLCRQGSVEYFEVYQKVGAYQREWEIREVNDAEAAKST